MNSALDLYRHNTLSAGVMSKKNNSEFSMKFSSKNERKILKVILLEQLHEIFYEMFYKTIAHQNIYSMECYAMDSQIIRLLIHAIIETEEYTLEGIARYTRIPFDIIFDVASGANNQFSITPLTRIVSLFLQVRPDIAQVLFDKLLDMKEKKHTGLLTLLNEF